MADYKAVTVYTLQEDMKQMRIELEDLRSKVKILLFQVREHLLSDHLEIEEISE